MTNNIQKGKTKWFQSILGIIIMSFIFLVLPLSILVFIMISKHNIDGGGWIILLSIISVFIYIFLLERNYKYEINRLTYRLKFNIVKHDRKIAIYTVLIMGGLIGLYELTRIIGDSHPLLPLFIERKDYYAIVISLCSLIVALFLSLKLDPKKIESGEDFLSALMIHAKDLQRKGTNTNKEELHIYSPNINIGVTDITQNKRDHSVMYGIVSGCDHVSFVFHCRNYSKGLTSALNRIKTYNDLVQEANQDDMLKFLLDYFKDEIHGKIDTLTAKCVNDLLNIVQFNNVQIKTDFNIQENMVGFRSKYEMVLGQYTDIDKTKGKVDFNGEVVTISEFIEFVPKIKDWD